MPLQALLLSVDRTHQFCQIARRSTRIQTGLDQSSEETSAYGAVGAGGLFAVGVEAGSAGVVLLVLGGVCSVSVDCTEPWDSASISEDVISSMPRNVVDGVLEGGGTVAEAEGRGGVVGLSAVVVVCDGGGGGGVGERRKLDSTICYSTEEDRLFLDTGPKICFYLDTIDA